MESHGSTTISPEPIETILAGGKPPWRPKVAGWCALLCSPMAGAFVAAASFRRMGQPRKAQQVIVYTLIASTAVLVPLMLIIPGDAPIRKLIGIALEGAGLSVFPSVLRGDYLKWKAGHPGMQPRNDYAATGWAILGLLTTLVMLFLIFVWDAGGR